MSEEDARRGAGDAGVTENNEPPESSLRRVAVHPGSGAARKNWPADRWCEVIAGLTGEMVVVIGEAESATWSREVGRRLERGLTEARIAGKRVELAVELPLRELAARMAGCDLFLGHDTGVSHLAAACGVPSVLLFGPTDPEMWAPPAPHVRVIRRGERMETITVAEVLAAAKGGAESVEFRRPAE